MTERYPEEDRNISEMPLEHNIEGNGNMMKMRPTWRMIEMLDLKGEMEAEGNQQFKRGFLVLGKASGCPSSAACLSNHRWSFSAAGRLNQPYRACKSPLRGFLAVFGLLISSRESLLRRPRWSSLIKLDFSSLTAPLANAISLDGAPRIDGAAAAAAGPDGGGGDRQGGDAPGAAAAAEGDRDPGVADRVGVRAVARRGDRKHAIMRRTGLPAHDLRVLDPVLSYPSSILGRERAVVVNLEHIKAVITAKEVLMINTNSPLVYQFVQDLQRRVSSSNCAAQ
ncbi:magnesium transporter MRS2-B-like [Eucalyptus grandis]|uniref:magnesium transporter MRS2-B-like n=1 Tax=Eucalyptus grandis TaxID=71139 RepID=UPI00192E871B|nr:magnesium transporter MRS2-B-like [Eucalyptus grandis]